MAEQKLTPQHYKELTQFLAFFNSKKEESFKELDLDFKDFSYDNLQETIFNKEDVEEVLKKWNEQVKKSLSTDFSNMNRMAAIYLQYLFQNTGVEFSLNLNLLEDIKMLDKMKKVESGEFAGGSSLLDSSSAPIKSSVRATGSKLPSLLEGQKTDLNLQKITELESNLEELRLQNSKLKEDLVKQMQTKKEQPSSQGGVDIEDFSTGNEEDLKKEIRTLNEKMTELQIENEKLNEETQKKLNESAQFHNLKKMIQQKNEQLKEVKDKQTFPNSLLSLAEKIFEKQIEQIRESRVKKKLQI